MLNERRRKMQKRQVPDADERAELVRKADRLWKLCPDPGEWYDKGVEASHTFNWENLSPEAKRVIPKEMNKSRAQSISTMSDVLREWARNPDTEGQPIPPQCDEIMELIDKL